jgi:NifB/MoaA-like Fe-S oxidoreductase
MERRVCDTCSRTQESIQKKKRDVVMPDVSEELIFAAEQNFNLRVDGQVE